VITTWGAAVRRYAETR